MIVFTEEERCLIDMYKDRSRMRTLEKMCGSLPYIESGEMLSLMRSAMEKLIKLDDREYSLLVKNESCLSKLLREEQ